MSTATMLSDAQHIDWAELLDEAMTMPGTMGNTYNRFYQYSLMNQVALWMQGVTGPVATYKRWQELGRQVQKGHKAKMILRPLMFSKEDAETGEKTQRVGGFKWQASLFELADTDGAELPPYAPAEWDESAALAALNVTRVEFAVANGNIAGYSCESEIAINPVAVYPFKTLIHELAHIVLGHTGEDADYHAHRGVCEFQAESVAYLVANELDALDQMNPSETRAYIQDWLSGTRPDDKAIRQVFTATDKILKAGRAHD